MAPLSPSFFDFWLGIARSQLARVRYEAMRKCAVSVRSKGCENGVPYNSNAFRFWANEKCVLGYSYNHNGDIVYCRGGHHFELLQSTQMKWGKGDEITVRVDCVNWRVHFERNGELVGKPQSIHAKAAYFPAVGMCQCKGHNYEVLD